MEAVRKPSVQVFLRAVLAGAALSSSAASVWALPQPDHVVIVVEENMYGLDYLGGTASVLPISAVFGVPEPSSIILVLSVLLCFRRSVSSCLVAHPLLLIADQKWKSRREPHHSDIS